MKAGDVLSIQWLVDRELSRDRVDDEDAGGGLVCTRPCHTVSEGAVFVMVRPDLWVQRFVNQSLKTMFTSPWLILCF